MTAVACLSQDRFEQSFAGCESGFGPAGTSAGAFENSFCVKVCGILLDLVPVDSVDPLVIIVQHVAERLQKGIRCHMTIHGAKETLPAAAHDVWTLISVVL